MSSIDPSAAQTALFEKLGISKNTDAKKASSDSLGQSDFLKVDDHSTSKSRSLCAHGQWRFHRSNGTVFDSYWYCRS